MADLGPMIPHFAFSVFVLLLVIAAICDLWKFVIPNLLCLAVLGLFIVTALLSPIEVNWWSHIGATVAVLVVGFGLFAKNWMGAGDVKLMTAIAIWMGFSDLPYFLVAMAIAGGVFSLVLLLLRRIFLSLRVKELLPRKLTVPRVLLVGEAVPYGVAIAAGAIFTGAHLPYLSAYL